MIRQLLWKRTVIYDIHILSVVVCYMSVPSMGVNGIWRWLHRGELVGGRI